MKYKDFTIKFANIDRNRMYRTESATVGTYWPTFTAAARYVLTCTRQAEEEEPAQPYDLYIDGDCVESFDTLTEARQAYDKAAEEHPDSVIDILSADGETSYIGQN